MYAVGRIGSYITRGVSTVSSPFHPFGGAVDIIVVEQPDGSFKSSPWYVRFGKFQGVLKAKEKIVNISVNGLEADIHMYLDQRGEAYFLREAENDGEESELYRSSSSSCDETDRMVDRRPLKSNSFDLESNVSDSIEFSNTKIVERTNSRRSRILGLVFGMRSMKAVADSFGVKDGGPGVDRVDSLERAEIAADLLEMRWSTNIPAKNYQKGGGSRLSAPISLESESKVDEVVATFDDNSVAPTYLDESVENNLKNDQASVVANNSGEIDINAQFIEINLSVDETSSTRKHDGVSADRVTISEAHGEVISDVISGYEEYVGDCVNQEADSSVIIAEDTGLILATPDVVEFEESETTTCLEFQERVHPAFEADEISLKVLEEKTGLYPQGETIQLPEGNLEIASQHCDSQTVSFDLSLHEVEDPVETKCSFLGASDATKEVEPESISCISGPTETNYFASNVNTPKDDLSKELQINAFSSSSPENIGVDNHCSKSPSTESQQSSEDEQFQFSYSDVHRPNKSGIARTASMDSVNQGTPLPARMGSSGQTDASDQESSTEDEDSREKRENISGAINIITGPTIDSQEGRKLAESLPDLRSQHGSFESCGPDHLLAHSLDSNYKSLEFLVHRKNDTSYVKSDNVEMETRGSREVSTSDNCGLAYKKLESFDRSVEISLCRHLLYEGTGMVSFGSDEIFEPKGMIAVDKNETTVEIMPSKAIVPTDVPSKDIVPAGANWRWPFSFKRARSRKVMNDGRNVIGRAKSMDDRPLLKANVKRKVRTTTPTSEQLASLNLKEGCNSITFSFCTSMLGKQQVDARIYMWKWNTRVIISDVDGTITKSDVLGQFMPLVGMDWSQTGVAHLYSAIKENGYQLLFLSARAISQAYHTRQFLFNLKQDGKSLPDGPVVISPDGLFPSLYREVIRRAPHEFKIATLQDIRDLFPADHNPFYAGFGNRNTDEISYLKVGIPKGKIFTINPKGEIAVNKHINTRSYTTLHTLVNGMFPPITSFEQEDFNSWNYWKLPPPEIDI
ncbi:hypothetical protein MLD38_034891 [Melastoma candidum]|uniref:Uncharacterized protein n=1 Tax=Melastoma candidum TaxID=119954 RepID=A0ACB9MD69_9MYRT|nr:hypothetical protein MLD38_034891 [Melastoma candidum]